MIRVLPDSAYQQETCGTILEMAVAERCLPSTQPTKVPHGIPGIPVSQAMLYGFRLPVIVTTVRVPRASLDRSATIGRPRPTAPTTVAACASVPAIGTGATAVGLTASPCVPSRKSK